ncbi:MAG: glycosyltransferase family 9 protein [Campylobacter sp.]
MKILLIRNDNVGDLICTTPAIEALRKSYPDAQIDIVVNSLNDFVVKNNPFISQIFSYTKPKHVSGVCNKIKAFFGKFGICLKIWQQKYDVAVIFRTHYTPNAALFARLNIRRVIGVDDLKNSKFITDKIKFDGEHEVEFCFKLLKPLGINAGCEKTLVVPSVKNDKFKNFVFFHISTRKASDALSLKKVGEILEILKVKFEKIVITSENCAFATQVSNKFRVLYLKTKSADELSSYLWCARFLISLEGGVFHLGPALGVDTLVLFGRTDTRRWAPIYGLGKCVVLQDESKIAENIAINSIQNAICDIFQE